jgi:hypothetical protein
MSRDCDCNSVVAGLINGEDICRIREAVCVQTEKVYDHCKEKDCIENEPVEFKENIQELIDDAFRVRTKSAEVIKVFADVEEIPFKRGFYTVNVKYIIKLEVEFCVKSRCHGVTSVTKTGFIDFTKTVVLFGSEGNVKIFKSYYSEDDDNKKSCRSAIEQDNLPIAKIEVAEPIVLNTRIKRVRCKPIRPIVCDCDCDGDNDGDSAVEGAESEGPGIILPRKRVLVTVGLFSIIKLVRFVQLLIPAFNFCYPNKECIASTDDDPCEIFDTIDFPLDSFFPPQKFDFPGAEEDEEEC